MELAMEDSEKIELLRLIEKIANNEGTPEEITAWLVFIERRLAVPEGYVSNLIFWPSRHGLGDDPSAEEIMNMALQYRPITL